MVAKLTRTIPALPVIDITVATEFYAARFGFRLIFDSRSLVAKLVREESRGLELDGIDREIEM